MSQIPDKVVRFYSNAAFALDVLENQRIAFVHASMLNDPFDPYGFFETDFGERYSSLLSHVEKSHPVDRHWFKEAMTHKSWTVAVRELKLSMKHLRETTFVLCACAEGASRPEHNLYMWGHYANGHRGIAIEFDTERLGLSIRRHSEQANGTLAAEDNVWSKMEYASVFEPLTAEHIFQFIKHEREIQYGRRQTRSVTALETYYDRMSTIKGEIWKAENEWRLMWRNDEINDPVYKCPISGDVISKVYLGLNIQSTDRIRISEAARKNATGIEILQSRKKHGEFALQFERL